MTRLSALPQTASVSCCFAVLHLADDQQAQTVKVAPNKDSAVQWIKEHADQYPHQLIVIKLHY